MKKNGYGRDLNAVNACNTTCLRKLVTTGTPGALKNSTILAGRASLNKIYQFIADASPVVTNSQPLQTVLEGQGLAAAKALDPRVTAA